MVKKTVDASYYSVMAGKRGLDQQQPGTDEMQEIKRIVYIYCMKRIRPDVDIIKDLLEAVEQARPADTFIKSLLFQYQERGGLSKKQLQGLHGKASKIEGIPPGKLATLEAIILKRPTREKSVLPVATPLYKPDEESGKKIMAILEKYPGHKRVLFFRSKFENNEPLSTTELAELQRFEKLLGVIS